MAKNRRRLCKCRVWSEKRADAPIVLPLTAHIHSCASLYSKALCDLADVAVKEKQFYLLWNNFMRTNPVLSEIQLPSQLRKFVQEHAETVVERDLDEQLISHLTNMWCEGVIGASNMSECMEMYNEIVVRNKSSSSSATRAS